MGNSQSESNTHTDSTEGPLEIEESGLSPSVGYRVLGVQAASPASYTDLVAHFDFIVAANDVPLHSLDTTFIEMIRACEEKPLTLRVFNTKNKSLREVVLVPSRAWPGEGLLGATIRFDTLQDCDDHVVHVLDVEEGSPAEIAGLRPNEDFLLGTLEKAFKDADMLFEELKANIDRPMEVFVYNTATDTVRVCVIMPTREWGSHSASQGILGADVAHGLLHRIPRACCATIGRSFESASQAIPVSVPVAESSTETAAVENTTALPPAPTPIVAEEVC